MTSPSGTALKLHCSYGLPAASVGHMAQSNEKNEMGISPALPSPAAVPLTWFEMTC